MQNHITNISLAKTLLLAAILVFVSNKAVYALEILTSPIEKLLDEQGQGPFGDMIREIETRIDKDITLTVLPWKRKSASWERGEGDALFPAIHWWTDQNGELNTEPVFFKRMHAFIAPTDAMPADVLALRDMDLTTILGYRFPPFIADNDIQFANKVVNEAAALNMVALGRTKAAVLELQSGQAALQRLALLGKVKVDIEQPLWIEKIGFALRNTKEGRTLKVQLDAAIRDMIKEGKLPWIDIESH